MQDFLFRPIYEDNNNIIIIIIDEYILGLLETIPRERILKFFKIIIKLPFGDYVTGSLNVPFLPPSHLNDSL